MSWFAFGDFIEGEVPNREEAPAASPSFCSSAQELVSPNECTAAKYEDCCIQEKPVDKHGLWVISVNSVPVGYVDKGNLHENMWQLAKDEQSRLYTTGAYSKVYIEPVTDTQIDLVAFQKFLLVSYPRQVATITCNFTGKLAAVSTDAK